MNNAILTLVICCLVSTLSSAQLKNNASNVSRYIELGDSLRNVEKKGDNARSMYIKAIALDSSNALGYHKIAQSFVADYRNEASERLLDSVIKFEHKARSIDPQFRDAYDWEVAAYRVKWRHGMIRKVLMDAIQHLPEDPEILMLLGRNYFDTGNPGLALPYLEKSIEVGGENAPAVAYRFAGWCWFYLENHEKQLNYFNQFRELDPKSLMGIAGQVHSYTGLRDFDKATALAIQIKEENPDYRYPAFLEAYIGETLLFGKQFQKAIPYYEKAMELNPTSDNLFATRAVTTTLGYLYLDTGQKEKGMKLLNQTIERRMTEWKDMPERWEFSFDIASAYAAMGELDLAYQWLYTSVITGYPGHLWKMDPVFSACHKDLAFQQLIRQARIRVQSEYESVRE
jgi:tetratricopeptide (TPR) repeat protein